MNWWWLIAAEYAAIGIAVAVHRRRERQLLRLWVEHLSSRIANPRPPLVAELQGGRFVAAVPEAPKEEM